MRNNSVGNRADEAQNNQLQIEFKMSPSKYLPKLTLYLSLSETRLDFPFFFTMMVQFVALAALQKRTITSAKNAGDRLVVWKACLRDPWSKLQWSSCDGLITLRMLNESNRSKGGMNESNRILDLHVQSCSVIKSRGQGSLVVVHKITGALFIYLFY